MILVVGATGHLGTEICRRLRDRGHPVRALVRASSAPDKVARLAALGVETVQGDLRHVPSLDAACAGASAVISSATMIATAQAGDSFDAVDERGGLALVAAARKARVDHFLYVSFDTANVPANPMQQAKAAVEDALRRGAMAYTILQPSLFMESWIGPASGLDVAAGTATILGEGERRISYIAVGDVAEFAVQCLEAPAARNATLRIGGAARTQREAIAAVEAAAGRAFTVQTIPEQALEQQWRSADDPMQRTFSALMLAAARGDEVPMADVLARFPVRLTTVEEHARRLVAGA